MALAGWLCFVALIVVLGNPSVVGHWASRPSDAAGLRFARQVLSYPEWGLPGYPAVLPRELGVAVTLRTALIVMVVGLLMFVTARSMVARPAGLGVMVTLWTTVVVGAGLVSALMAPVILAVDAGGSLPSLNGHLIDAVVVSGGAGAGFGFWVGWLPALVAAPFGRLPSRAAGVTPGPTPGVVLAGR